MLPNCIVILPTYREKLSIKDCILEFAALDFVSRIIVVNNNAELGTSEQIPIIDKVSEIFETQQGYGRALKTGIVFALKSLQEGEYLVLCEPDGTFVPSDLIKLAAFASDVDLVLGSRTVSSFIWSNANMGPFLRWGNWLWAKIIELLFNTVYLSDVGCTFRVMNKDFARELAVNQEFLGNKSTFGLEVTLWAAALKRKFVQIPVNYKERSGISSVTGSQLKAFNLGMHMLILIIIRRFSGVKGWHD